jgi:hypothetical protein
MYSFIPKNKIEKLVHLVGFIIRICHDARSPERQTVAMFVWLLGKRGFKVPFLSRLEPSAIFSTRS